MGDGSSAFVIEILELLRGANDTTTLQLCVPHPLRVLHMLGLLTSKFWPGTDTGPPYKR
eukprot:COSAG03_NODE_184_length_10942_cov_103.227520_2_plen_59_part_00